MKSMVEVSRNTTQCDKQARHITLLLRIRTKEMSHENMDLPRKKQKNMYKRKLLARTSYHNAILSSIMATCTRRTRRPRSMPRG